MGKEEGAEFPTLIVPTFLDVRLPRTVAGWHLSTAVNIFATLHWVGSSGISADFETYAECIYI
jgi:hypothetical protein